MGGERCEVMDGRADKQMKCYELNVNVVSIYLDVLMVLLK